MRRREAWEEVPRLESATAGSGSATAGSGNLHPASARGVWMWMAAAAGPHRGSVSSGSAPARKRHGWKRKPCHESQCRGCPPCVSKPKVVPVLTSGRSGSEPRQSKPRRQGDLLNLLTKSPLQVQICSAILQCFVHLFNCVLNRVFYSIGSVGQPWRAAFTTPKLTPDGW